MIRDKAGSTPSPFVRRYPATVDSSIGSVIGTVLSGRYRLESKLGSGGMSTVYLATDETLDRPVAIKLLHAEISDQPEQLERFRREARAAARLSHPNLVGVIDAGEEDGRRGGELPATDGEVRDGGLAQHQLPLAPAGHEDGVAGEHRHGAHRRAVRGQAGHSPRSRTRPWATAAHWSSATTMTVRTSGQRAARAHPARPRPDHHTATATRTWRSHAAPRA